METGITHLVIRGEGDLATVLPKVKAAGYDGMEVLLTDDSDLTLESSDAEIDRVGQLFADAGMSLQSMCPAIRDRGNLVTDEAAAERFRAVCDGASRICARLGIDTILIIPGGVTPEVPYDVCYEKSLAGLKTLRPIADRWGVNFAIEYVWNNMFLSPLELRQCLDAVGHPKIGFYMDTGNMMAFGYAEQWIRILGPHIKKIHTKNFRRRPHWSWPNLLSEGDADWPAIWASIVEIGYDGPLISEMSGTWEQHAENAAFTKRLIGAARARQRRWKACSSTTGTLTDWHAVPPIGWCPHKAKITGTLTDWHAVPPIGWCPGHATPRGSRWQSKKWWGSELN